MHVVNSEDNTNEKWAVMFSSTNCELLLKFNAVSFRINKATLCSVIIYLHKTFPYTVHYKK